MSEQEEKQVESQEVVKSDPEEAAAQEQAEEPVKVEEIGTAKVEEQMPAEVEEPLKEEDVVDATEPEKVEAEPEKVSPAVPEKVEAVFEKVEAVPEEVEAVPEKVEAVPEKVEAVPEKVEEPVKVEAVGTAKVEEPMPAKAETSSETAKVEEPMPAKAETSSPAAYTEPLKKEEDVADATPEKKVKKKKRKSGKRRKSTKGKKKAGFIQWDLLWMDEKINHDLESLAEGKTCHVVLSLTRKKGANYARVVSSGDGGLESVRKCLGDPKGVFYAWLKASATDASGSDRTKFIFIKYLGNRVSPMLKGGLNANNERIQTLFTSGANGSISHTVIAADEDYESLLTAESLAKGLLTNAGSHQPDKYSFHGPGEEKCQYVVKK